MMTYEVRSGDTLSAIAQRHQTSLATVLRLNNQIENPDLIFPGQRIRLPENLPSFSSERGPGEVVAPPPCCDEIVEIVHVTGSNELLFLTQDELDQLVAEETLVCEPVNNFYRDLAAFREAGLQPELRPLEGEGVSTTEAQQRKDALVSELEARGVVDQSMQSIPPITEIKRLVGNKHYTYVRSDQMRNHRRSYSMDARDRDRRQGWLGRGGVDLERLREAVRSQLNAKFNFSWSPDADNPLMVGLNQYYDEVTWSVWGDEEAQRVNRDRTGFDASAEAQFMRFAAGGAVSGEFNPRNGKVHLQGKAEAQFSLADGKATIEQSFPANNDSEIRIYFRRGGWDGPRDYASLGHFQARLAITASGFAGASALLAANIHVDSSSGVPSIRGIASGQRDQGANLQAGAFAGIRGGCEVAGSLLWVDVLSRQSDWKTLCKVGKKVEAAAGLGAEAELRLRFSRATGKFSFNVHAGLVVGVGASGSFLLEVEALNVMEMVHFVYKALGDADFRYLELFDVDTEAFEWYRQMALYALGAGLDYANASSRVIEQGIGEIQRYIERFVDEMSGQLERENFAKSLATNLINDISMGEQSVFLHSPPEVKGAVLDKLLFDYHLTPMLLDGTRMKVRAIAMVLQTFQGGRDLEESLSRMNPEGVKQPGTFDENLQRVFRFIGKNQHDLQMYRRILDQREAVLAGPVQLDPFGACRNCGVIV